jgi:hypothetical protein
MKFKIYKIVCFFVGHKIVESQCERCLTKFGVPLMTNPQSPPFFFTPEQVFDSEFKSLLKNGLLTLDNYNLAKDYYCMIYRSTGVFLYHSPKVIVVTRSHFQEILKESFLFLVNLFHVNQKLNN